MRKSSGFTLIEVILSILILGIMAALGGMAIVTAARGYLFVRDNASLGEKAQMAMARMSRELIEALDITSAEESRITYTRLSGDSTITQTIYLSSGRIKMASGSSASGGDDLTDCVGSLTFGYYKGASSWVPGTDDITLLSSIQINLVLARPDGSGNLAFSTSLSPRNNRNAGGVAPTTNPPAKIGYCFVATAACGDVNHPIVVLLRQFRDRFLSTWAGGRALVQAYYAAGPAWAKVIENRPWACGLARWVLGVPAGLTFLLIYCPACIPSAVLLFWLAFRLAGGLRMHRRERSGGSLSDQRGSVLIGLIFIMVALSALGAAMLPLTNSSTVNQIGGNNSTKAYFLAESGYRYVASEYLNAATETAKDDRLEALHAQTFTLSNNAGKFQPFIYPYYFRTTADPSGSSVMIAKPPGGFPPEMALSSGYLKVNGVVHSYSSASRSGPVVSFTRSGGTWPSVPVGSVVYPVSRPLGTQTVNNGANNYLVLESSTGSANALPIHNSTFKIEGSSVVYSYMKRNGSRLEGISLSDNPDGAFSVNVTGGSNIVLDKFLKMRAVGIYSQGNDLEAKREIVYHVPIGYTAAGTHAEKVAQHETFDGTSNWFTGSEQGELGGHQVVSVSGNNALHVTSAESPALFSGVGQWSLIQFNWSGTNANLQAAWENAGHLLSYDAQVKAKATDQPYFMAGVSFRTLSTGSDLYCYGISFLKARQTRWKPIFGSAGSWFDTGDIPSSIIPSSLFSGSLEVGSTYFGWVGIVPGFWQDRYSQPAIVLWQRTESGFRWLAYKVLAATDGVVANNSSGWPRLIDWSSLQLRVIEAYPLPFSTGGPSPLLYGETVIGETSGARAEINGTPILTSGAWSSGNAAGKLTVCKVEGAFASGESLLVNGVARARAQGTLGGRANYIRAYYGDTSLRGTPNNVPADNNRQANLRAATSGQLHWPVDDVSGWASDNDYMSLVQWGAELNTGVVRSGTGSELNAVIEDSALTTPTSGDFTRSEIALHTSGGTSASIYFDDFAIQVAGSSGSVSGFLPPILQE